MTGAPGPQLIRGEAKQGAEQGPRQRYVSVGVVQHPEQAEELLQLLGVEDAVSRLTDAGNPLGSQGLHIEVGGALDGPEQNGDVPGLHRTGPLLVPDPGPIVQQLPDQRFDLPFTQRVATLDGGFAGDGMEDVVIKRLADAALTALGELVRHDLQQRSDVVVAMSPGGMFREYKSLLDKPHPDVVTVWLKDSAENIFNRLIFTDVPSAEMIKYAANSMLATRISFMNDIANLCEIVGANVNMVRKGIGSDTRIGAKFLYPGCGYGGSCFPKDVKALIKTAEQNGYDMQVLKAVEKVNERQKGILFEKLAKHFGGELKGMTVAMWGLSFKPETDDMREAPSLVLIEKMLQHGMNIKVYDPVAMDECRRRIGDKVTYCNDKYEATIDADALMLVTEWKEFRMSNWNVVKKTMKQPVIFDGRNLFDSTELNENGFAYYKIG